MGTQTRLANTYQFLSIAPGDSATFVHGLRVASKNVAPDKISLDTNGKFTVASSPTTVTLTNVGDVAAAPKVLVECYHTYERAFGGSQNVDLPIKPFIIGDAGDESGAVVPSLVYVYAPGNPLGRHANVYTDFNELMADYVLRDKTLGTGTISFDGAWLPGGGPPIMTLPAKTGGGKYDVSDTRFSSPSDGPFLLLDFAVGCQFFWDAVGTSDRDFPFLVIDGFRLLMTKITPWPGAPFEVPDFAGMSFVGFYQPVGAAPGAGPLIQLAPFGFGVLSVSGGYHQGFVDPGVVDLNGALLRGENLNFNNGALVDSSGGLGLFFSQERSADSMCGFEGDLQWVFPGLVPGSNGVAHQLLPRMRYKMNFAFDFGAGDNPFLPPVIHTEPVGSPYVAHYNELVLCDTSGGDVGVELPTAIWPQGEIITVKIVQPGSDVVVSVPSGQSMDGVADGTHVLVGEGKVRATFVTDGYGNWIVI